MLSLDGVYQVAPDGTRLRFQWARESTFAPLTQLAHSIAHRVGRLLEREGLLERDTKQLAGEMLDEDDPMSELVGHSITCRIAVGPAPRPKGVKACPPFSRKAAPACTWYAHQLAH